MLRLSCFSQTTSDFLAIVVLYTGYHFDYLAMSQFRLLVMKP